MRTLIAIVGLLVLAFGATPASAEVVCASPDLPPGCGEYRTPADVHAVFANSDPAIIEAILHDISHARFLNIIITPLGPDGLEDFDSTLTALVDVELTGGTVLTDLPVALSGPVSVLTQNKTSNTTGTFDTEIIAMSLTGNLLGMPVEVRESPSLATLGQTTITDLGGGLYEIDSFFDVFTELSLNGGAFVAQMTGPSRVDLVEPPTCGEGLIEGAEECDDGNAIDNDNCTNACQFPICGDGVIWDQGMGTEMCDDGDPFTPGDGCDTGCQIESGWTCIGEPSACSVLVVPTLSRYSQLTLIASMMAVGLWMWRWRSAQD